MSIQVSPSLMCMDFLHIQSEIEILSSYANEFHIDILDYHYCKNLSLTPPIMKQIASITNVPIDAHLYMDPIDLELIEWCIECGAQIITLPIDVIRRQAFAIKKLLQHHHVQFGLFLNPSDSISLLEPFLPILDRVLVLSVDPGFAGQSFIPSTIERIEKLVQLRKETKSHFTISVDGCCNEKHYKALYQAGAEIFILGGSGLFSKDKDTKKAIEIALSNIKKETGENI